MHGNKFHTNFISLLFILIFPNLPFSTSEIRTVQISSDDRAFILLQDFGFKSPGFISLSVSSFSINDPNSSATPTRLSFMGFFYGPSPARPALILALLKGSCILGSPFVFPILKLGEKPVGLKKTVPVTIPDLYYIFFVNCAKNSSVSMTVDLESYNLGEGRRDYSDEHLADLPRGVFVFSLVFFVFVLAWSHACVVYKRFLNRIHILMAFLLFSRFLELVCYANSLYSIRQTGSARFWNFLWLGFYFSRSVLFALVVVLIGSGWSIYRPVLQDFHKHVVSTAVSLQISSSVCFVLMRAFGPSSGSYKNWAVSYYTLDFLCCVAMVLPVFSEGSDRSGVGPAGSKTEGKEAKALVHERVFGKFGLALYGYVGSTRLGIFAMRCFGGHGIWYATIVLEMTVGLAFYLVVYCMFWPNEKSYDYVAPDSKEGEISVAILPGV
ncbi:lung seven transmembrane receptor family protein [Striga asiatica]|uniref:Lung seven transmembrane receptor family protein n=1 Tax=Striga asiatica TaxID=4170 RepID=A0A5A7R2C9_STRAF|nr:lung seven transmembrane receptor family protein [Striga asiatica]